VRVGGTGKYQAARNSHSPLLFQAYVRMSTDNCDYIVEMAREELHKPLNQDLPFTRAENDACQARKRILDAADHLRRERRLGGPRACKQVREGMAARYIAYPQAHT
jgi:hypothetical protein